MNATLLIAGLGYLGAELRRQSRLAGWQTIGLSKHGGPDHLACDLSSAAAVDELARSLPRKDAPTALVHCASSGRGGVDAYQAVFVGGVRNLLDTFPDRPFVFVSSSSVYGQLDGSTVTEESPTAPERETSRLLLEAETLALDGGGCVARLAGIYGPHRSIILQRLLDGTAGIEEDGRRILNQIHRDDAAAAILHLLQARRFPAGEVFNVVDSNPLSQAECYTALAERFDLPLPPTIPRNTTRKRAWTNKRVSNAKLLRSGWNPQFPDFLEAAAAIAPTLSSNGTS